MSCHSCANKFGIFVRENGCPSCGFAYCNKCLKRKIAVPKLDNTVHTVCKCCFESLVDTGKSEPQKEEYSPPAAYLRRLESLENPARPPITVYQHDQRMEQLKSGLTQTDRAIVERLQKLREDHKKEPAPSEEDILRRLAALKGEDADHRVALDRKKSVVHLAPDTRSDEEKTDHLIKQLLEEQILSAKQISPEDMIARRLAKLRGEDPPAQGVERDSQASDIKMAASTSPKASDIRPVTADDVQRLLWEAENELRDAAVAMRLEKGKQMNFEEDLSSSDEENNSTIRIVEKVLHEAHLDLDTGGDLKGQTKEEIDEDDDEDYEQRPWCVICNKDATLRCLGCSRDLYCQRCFSEGHDVFDMKDHKTEPFNGGKHV